LSYNQLTFSEEFFFLPSKHLEYLEKRAVKDAKLRKMLSQVNQGM